MRRITIQNSSQALPAPLAAVYCESFLCRLRGLMFRSRLDPERGLLLVERRDSRVDTAIHMLFVFMDLGVVWINSDLQVVDTVLARAWRPAYVPRHPARYILEIAPGRLAEFRVGDVIRFENA